MIKQNQYTQDFACPRLQNTAQIKIYKIFDERKKEVHQTHLVQVTDCWQKDECGIISQAKKSSDKWEIVFREKFENGCIAARELNRDDGLLLK